MCYEFVIEEWGSLFHFYKKLSGGIMAKIKIKDFIEENLRDFLVENGYEL